MKQILLTLALLSSSCSFAQTQGETSNWYFGDNAGINFNNNVVTPLTNGQLFTGEGCSSISTKQGQLLFYTDGVTVYNRNHIVMPNGTGLLGGSSSTQSAIIVPAPGNANKYYIFTCIAGYPTNTGVHYSVVDMTLNGGLGDITTKNFLLFENSSEKLAAIQHQDGINYWVVAKTSFNTCYYSYLINCDGVQDLNPVVSCVGTKEVDSWALPGGAIFSPDGTKLVGCAQDTLEIISFNTATGSLTNPMLLPLPTDYRVYSAAFSPNNQLLYMNSRVSGEVYQMDISSNNSTTILNSRQLLGLTNGGLLGGYKGGALQLGPDNKIYAAQNESTYLGVINNPNTTGTGCNFQADAISLNGKLCRQGLPPFISSFFAPLDSLFSVNGQHSCTGIANQFSLSDNSSYIDSIVWNFGDVTNNRAVGNTVSHTYNTPGTYLIKATRYIRCVKDEFFYTITITSTPILNNGLAFNNVSACPEATMAAVGVTSTTPLSGITWTSSNPAIGLSNGNDNTDPYAVNSFVGGANNTLNDITSSVHITATSLDGCASSDNAGNYIITLHPQPILNNGVAFGNVSSCPEATMAAVGVTSTTALSGITWTSSNPAIGLSNGNDNTDPYAVNSFVGGINNTLNDITSNVHITATSLDGCASSDNAGNYTITLHPQPILNNGAAFANINTCSQEIIPAVPITTNMPINGITWNSSNPATGLNSGNDNTDPYAINSFTTAINSSTTPIVSNVHVYATSLLGCNSSDNAGNYNINLNNCNGFGITINNGDTTIACLTDSLPLNITVQSADGCQLGNVTWTSINGNGNYQVNSLGNATYYFSPDDRVNGYLDLIAVGTAAAPCQPTEARDTIRVTFAQDTSTISVTNWQDATIQSGQFVNLPPFLTTPAGGTVVWTNSNVGTGIPAGGFTDIPPYYAPENNTTSSIVSEIQIIPAFAGCKGLTQTFYVTLIPSINVKPVASDDINITIKTIAIVGRASINDYDIYNDPLIANVLYGTNAISAITANGGTVFVYPNGDYVYNPNPDFVGVDTFTYQICDNGTPALCDTAVVRIFVIENNLRKNEIVANADFNITTLVHTAQGNVLNNDTDPEGDNLLLQGITTQPLYGTVVLDNATGNYIYVQNTATTEYTQDVFTYTVCDDNALPVCTTARVTILLLNIDTINLYNDKPFAGDDAAVTIIQKPISGNILNNDWDINGDNLTITPTLISGVAHGTLLLLPNGNYTYTPDSGYTGSDNFIYEICDEGVPTQCIKALVSFLVLNLPPVAANDIANTFPNTPVNGNVKTNDYDISFNRGNWTLLQLPTNGLLTFIDSTAKYTYTPSPNFVGRDSFYYQYCDEGFPVFCDTAAVYIQVIPNNPRQNEVIANADYTIVAAGQNGAGNVLVNDIDPEGNTLTVTPITNVQGVYGTFTILPNGEFTYLSPATTAFYVEDSIYYQVCDNQGLCATAILVVKILPIDITDPINDPPFAGDDAVALFPNIPATGNVLTNDRDVNGDILTVNTNLVIAPMHGTVVLNPNGTYTYTPNLGYTGTDQFVYQVCDNGTPSICATATVFISIYNTPPFANNDINTLLINTSTAGNVSTNDQEWNAGQVITTSLLQNPSHGTLTLNADGTYTYTPTTNYVGQDVFTYTICDDGTPAFCDTAKVVIQVVEGSFIKDELVANDDYVITTNTATLPAIAVLANDIDPELAATNYTVTILNLPAQGTATVNPDGTIQYISNPTTPPFTEINFTYIVCETATNMCDTAEVTIFIEPNPNPYNPPNNPRGAYAIDDAIILEVNGSKNSNVLTNDYALPTEPLTATVLTNPSHGTLTMNPNGAYTYTPITGYVGNDNFTYVACDGGTPPICDTATVYIVVLPTPPPIIAVNKQVRWSENPDGTFAVTFTIGVTNLGLRPIKNVQISDDLVRTFGQNTEIQVVSITGFDLSISTNYTGINADTFLLIGNDTLAPGQIDSVVLTVIVKPTGSFSFANSAIGTGEAPNGFGNTIDLSNWGAFETVVDSLPNVLEDNQPTGFTLKNTVLFIPEGFSPNGDNTNDKFVIEGIQGKKISMSIFNRWGNEVYQNDDYQNQWDGTATKGVHFGNQLPDATYYYLINVLNGQNYIGFITIKR